MCVRHSCRNTNDRTVGSVSDFIVEECRRVSLLRRIPSAKKFDKVVDVAISVQKWFSVFRPQSRIQPQNAMQPWSIFVPTRTHISNNDVGSLSDG